VQQLPGGISSSHWIGAPLHAAREILSAVDSKPASQSPAITCAAFSKRLPLVNARHCIPHLTASATVVTVFLSYRHESDAHRERVLAFGKQLRATGIAVVLDQFYLDANPGGPDEGWPTWSKNLAPKSEKVLIVGSPGWYRCYDGRTCQALV
jgi:SEFIR domain